MQLISKFNKELRFLLCENEFCNKYAWVIPLRDKRGITITNAFQKILKESNRKPNEIWFDKGGQFYNRSMKSWSEKKGIEMYSTQNEDKKTCGSGIKNENIPNKELAKELHKPIIRKSNKRKVHSPFIDNIRGADLVDMQLISKFNKELRFLLCENEFCNKYAWVIPLRDKRGITITNAFQKILKESNRKPNKIWVVKRSEFYNSSFKKWLKYNDIEMYSIHNEGKFVVAAKFIRTLKTKIYKCMRCVYQ